MSEAAIKVPRRTSDPDALTLVAHYNPKLSGGDVDLVPSDVADELGLSEGAKIRVKKKPLLHTQYSKVLRQAADSEAYVEPMELLQAIIDHTVTDSNLGIHPDAPGGQVRISDMDCEALPWWLYSWLGADKIMARVTGHYSHVEESKKKPGSS